MSLHGTTFDYLKPTDMQMTDMALARLAFAELVEKLDELLPDGPDKTHVYRVLRTAAMWSNVCITRQADGQPRQQLGNPEYPPDHPAPGDLGSVPL